MGFIPLRDVSRHPNRVPVVTASIVAANLFVFVLELKHGNGQASARSREGVRESDDSGADDRHVHARVVQSLEDGKRIRVGGYRERCSREWKVEAERTVR